MTRLISAHRAITVASEIGNRQLFGHLKKGSPLRVTVDEDLPVYLFDY